MVMELHDKLTIAEDKVVAAEKSVKFYHEEFKRISEKARQEELYVECYRKLQTAILGNPGLMDEWVRFCTMLKLTDPEIYKFTTQP